ncbi:hypothetical protein B0H12DRAFT_775570 [Mycena haematopus]|nr:hypothetical protein B0H12DRAFT_775570 [Mycena haematopus]
MACHSRSSERPDITYPTRSRNDITLTFGANTDVLMKRAPSVCILGSQAGRNFRACAVRSVIQLLLAETFKHSSSSVASKPPTAIYHAIEQSNPQTVIQNVGGLPFPEEEDVPGSCLLRGCGSHGHVFLISVSLLCLNRHDSLRVGSNMTHQVCAMGRLGTSASHFTTAGHTERRCSYALSIP